MGVKHHDHGYPYPLMGGELLIRPRALLADDHPALLEATAALLKRSV
jgi:hypothetical protein